MAQRRKAGEFFEILDKMSKKKPSGSGGAARGKDVPLEEYNLRSWRKPLQQKPLQRKPAPVAATPSQAAPAAERSGEPETMTFRRGTVLFTGVAMLLLVVLAYMLGAQRGSSRRPFAPRELAIKAPARRTAPAETRQWGVLAVSYENTRPNRQEALKTRGFLLESLVLQGYQVKAEPHGRLVHVYIGTFATRNEASVVLGKVRDLRAGRGYPFRNTAYIIGLTGQGQTEGTGR